MLVVRLERCRGVFDPLRNPNDELVQAPARDEPSGNHVYDRPRSAEGGFVHTLQTEKRATVIAALDGELAAERWIQVRVTACLPLDQARHRVPSVLGAADAQLDVVMNRGSDPQPIMVLVDDRAGLVLEDAHGALR